MCAIPRNGISTGTPFVRKKLFNVWNFPEKGQITLCTRHREKVKCKMYPTLLVTGAVVHLNFRAGSIFPVPVCTVPSSMDRTRRCNKVDAVRLYTSFRLNLLLLKGQRCVWYNFENILEIWNILILLHSSLIIGVMNENIEISTLRNLL